MVVTEIEGVVKIADELSGVPPTAAANHFTVPVEEEALRTTVPVPQRPPGVVDKITGNGLTATLTALVSEQPVAVMVSVSTYVVVLVGLADGSATVELLKVADGDHE